jgi:iron complex transport system substrate-binding protein
MALRILPALLLAAGAAAAEPVTIQTARGPETIEAPPQRVVVFDIAALDTIGALGVEPVGVPENLYVPYLERPDGAEAVGDIFEPDFEAVAALGPDLIVIGSRSSPQYEALSRIAPTVDMTLDGSGSLIGQALARLETYGALFGREDEARRLMDEIEAAIGAARRAVSGKGDALIVMTNGPKVSAYGPGSRFGWLHAELGLAPAMPDVDAAIHGEAISFEFIHDANPDWLIVVDRAAAIGETGDGALQTLDNQLVAGTTAWREGNLVALDAASIYVAGGGVRSLTGVLHDLTAAFAE